MSINRNVIRNSLLTFIEIDTMSRETTGEQKLETTNTPKRLQGLSLVFLKSRLDFLPILQQPAFQTVNRVEDRFRESQDFNWMHSM